MPETDVEIIPKGLHAAEHEAGGIDVMTVAGLAGLLLADQHVLNAEVLSVAEALGVAAGLIATHAALPNEHHAQVHTHLTVAETEVFAGNSPNPSAWTDLNLSGTVGAQATLVLLKINSANAQFQVSVRKNGDTDEFFGTAADVQGAATSAQGAGKHCVLVVATDASGIIEWKASNVTIAYTIDIIAYIK